MAYTFPRCEILPLPGERVSFQVDGGERLQWHFGPDAPRPFFYPFVGPSGASLTRMGHPGAANHDHHRSVWFAHHKVLGIDFWSDRTAARIRQKHWLAYVDGEAECLMAVRLGWYDGHDPQDLLEQELIAAVRPGPERETFLELQTTFRPQAESLEFGRTNFGFLAVRVAKHLSEYFGGGTLTDSAGRTGERAIFGKRAEWMDYSGPARGRGPDPAGSEGITYFDHPDNPRFPSYWHVREDGWMGASVCMKEPIETTRDEPLVLRWLLHAHRGPVDPQRAGEILEEFGERPGLEVVETPDVKHRQSLARRRGS